MTVAASPQAYGEVSWERMIRAVEKVHERLHRAAAALDAAGVPYAVAGGVEQFFVYSIEFFPVNTPAESKQNSGWFDTRKA